MNITDEQWTPMEDEELTTESLVSRLLNQSPSLDNFVRGLEDMETLLQEGYERGKRTTQD